MDQAVYHVLKKCGIYAETSLKLLSTIMPRTKIHSPQKHSKTSFQSTKLRFNIYRMNTTSHSAACSTQRHQNSFEHPKRTFPDLTPAHLRRYGILLLYQRQTNHHQRDSIVDFVIANTIDADPTEVLRLDRFKRRQFPTKENRSSDKVVLDIQSNS